MTESEFINEAYEEYVRERNALLRENGVSEDYIDNLDIDLAENAFKAGFKAGCKYAFEEE